MAPQPLGHMQHETCIILGAPLEALLKLRRDLIGSQWHLLEWGKWTSCERIRS